MSPEEVPAALTEAAANVLDPEAFEEPLRWYSERAAEQSRGAARETAAEILAVVLPLWTAMVDETRRSVGPRDSDGKWPQGDRYSAPPGEGF